MDCFMGCINHSADPSTMVHTSVVVQGCKTRCVDEYECGFGRDVWTQARTDWCCACQGQRCPSSG
eukprot:5896499-Prymnesium_polylepis.1